MVYSIGLAEFSERSLQALTIRMSEFETFLKILKVRSVKTITYQHLIDFVLHGSLGLGLQFSDHQVAPIRRSRNGSKIKGRYFLF